MSKLKGRRALQKAPPKIPFAKGDEVLAESVSGKSLRTGVVEDIIPGKQSAFVKFDDGQTRIIHINALLRKPIDDDDEDEDAESGLGGFNQYVITWSQQDTHFKFDVEGVHFYGWYRKTVDKREMETCWAIDLFAVRGPSSIDVCTIPYLHGDPRKNMRSLNADLCTAANGFLFNKCKGSFGTIDELYRRAKMPQLRIKKLEIIDRIILQLKEFRDTAVRLGGRRHFKLQAEFEDDPALGIELDLSGQAFKLKGKVPSLREGMVYDDDNTSREPGKRARIIEHKADDANVSALVEQLKSTTDKSEARKIRATLRRMGHTGGARSLSAAAQKSK